jgi:primosomal protein N' (replication factor Y)
METATGSQLDLFTVEPEVARTTVPDKGAQIFEALAADLFAEIVFDRPLDQAYTYAVPADLTGALSVGKRVQAPFGRGDRPTVGYCVGISSQAPGRAAKVLQRVLDEEPLLSPKLLRLTRWLADYYICGWGQVLNAVLPAGVRSQAGTRVQALVELVPEAEMPTDSPELTAKQQAALAQLQAAGKALEPRHLARLAGCSQAPIDQLVSKGLARRVYGRLERQADNEKTSATESPLELNPAQLQAWAPIEGAVRRGGFQAFLLYGVTGSGKTEIYLRAIEEVVRDGKEAIVLVPEISLTPQTIERFRGRFGSVAVLHSHLSDAERGSQWRRVMAGQVQVVVGARSAVFAPTNRLGLIVIDEEHESSFKQDATPRYHARDVAVMRARLEDVPIVLGSATPSLESWHNAQRKQYTLLELPHRVLDLPMPKVALIDMRTELSRRGPQALSLPLELAVRETLKQSGQVMLLLNRRGFSTYVHCTNCGRVEMCRFCDLALTFHRQRGVLLCHYCGYEQTPVDRCCQCNKTTVRYQGLGTEKLQAEIESKFPGATVHRMDSDSMKQSGSHERVLTAFRKGLIDILMGTQMIAKGLDFPNVTLVGVINADVGLNIPDFRAAERTFQLLSQVAGRTGRGPRGGKVLVQTFNTEQQCILRAAQHDYKGFVGGELTQRRAHGYPPYERLARVIIRSRKEAAAAEFAERMAGAFRTTLGALAARARPAAPVRLLGPAEAPVFRLKGYHRFHFQLQSASAATLHEVLRSVLGTVRCPSGVEFSVDVDPFNML